MANFLDTTVDDLIENFEFLGDWEERFAYLIELGKKLLESNARNLWTIGTVGLAPQPVVISSKLRGVTNEGIWGWDNRWTLSYHPSTWYFESNTTIPGTTNYGATNNDRE